MKKKLAFFFFILLTVAATLWLSHGFLLTQAGEYLVMQDPPQNADAIVVVSGSKDRIYHAIDLWNQQAAPILIVSGAANEGPASDALVMALIATDSGVPESAIILEDQSKNTYENVVNTSKIIEDRHFSSIILVTAPYHQRRLYETFKKVGPANLTLINSPSAQSPWKATSWWKDAGEKRITVSELAKVVWARISGNYH